ncbi:insulinase family protein [Candidatus Pacearchaeota archaeon]|nr:insulinase family protein [Candidatus Pacearchaeota archaeon]
MNFQKKKLKNGITVLHEQRDLPVVAVSITNPFGGACEESEIKGIAHVIEHLLFTGTKTRTHEDISREIEKKGGILNAFTAQQVTSFWFKLPSEHIFAGLDILTDMLNNPAFPKEKFEKEKKVILEEIKMYHDNPRMSIMEQIEKNLYDKPFGELIIGSKETVSAIDRDFLMKYFKKMYNPKNFIVTLVGKADFKKVCDYLEKNFHPSDGTPEIKPIKKLNKETTEARPGIDQAHLVFAVHAPKASHPDYPALEVLDAYLADGMSSKLFLEIREKRGLAYAVKSDIETEKDYSHYTIYVGTTKQAIPEVKKLILEGFEDVKNMTEKDLEEAKERVIGLNRISKEESVNVMSELMFAELTTKAEDYYTQEKKINAVDLEQVKSLAKINSYSAAVIVPK